MRGRRSGTAVDVLISVIGGGLVVEITMQLPRQLSDVRPKHIKLCCGKYVFYERVLDHQNKEDAATHLYAYMYVDMYVDRNGPWLRIYITAAAGLILVLLWVGGHCVC